MRTLTTRTPDAAASTDRGFDRYLGPASARYFGNGYSKVAYGIDELDVHPAREDREAHRPTFFI